MAAHAHLSKDIALCIEYEGVGECFILSGQWRTI